MFENPTFILIVYFRRELVENCALLSHYAASSGNFLPTFWDILSVPFSRPLKIGPIGCPETWVRNYHFSLRNDPEERISQPQCTLQLVCEDRVLSELICARVFAGSSIQNASEQFVSCIYLACVYLVLHPTHKYLTELGL
jgi:hypothetical protein